MLRVGVVVLVLFSGSLFAAESCKKIQWQAGDIITVEASLHMATHVTFPEDHIDVIVGSNKLWAADYVKNHLWIKPTTQLKEGRETTVTYVGQSNHSYEVLVRRTTRPHTFCYMVEATAAMINKTKWTRARDAEQGGLSTLELQRRFQRQQRQMTQNVVEQTQDALRKYRRNIFTGYDITEGEGWFSNNGKFVESVYDDGRFTYIRVTDDSRGLMSVYAEIDGKQELLEVNYDPATKVYEVSGVFPMFKLKHGNSELMISRDNHG